MAIGRGKYGGIAEELVERFKAQGIIVAILNGDRGNGIELAGPAMLHAALADFLQAVAKDIRANALADAAAIQAGEAATPRTDQ